MKSIQSILRRIVFMAAIAIPVCAVEPTGRVVVLHLKLSNGGIALVDSRVITGHIKAARDESPAKGLHVEARADDNSTLWSENIPDPQSELIESFDPAIGGGHRDANNAAEPEFTIRVPATPRLHHINVFRDEPLANGATHLSSAGRKLVGQINVPKFAEQ